ncbi:uncharacterized protein LOC18030095 isoform X1 [Eutrema salsugineum]|uniref:uncharacterized protein LOC18030095 isoform X1 n=1 Tax=Eutrema salsugineum TaxID=72664 RepID=UPI000CED4C77|nr:uncharacterized protein LOC18030095 isoform X1 [Eutrema salsugineum]
MATAIVRSALSRATIRAAPRTSVAHKRSFSSSAGHDDAYEAAKWEKITYLGIASCTALAVYVLSKGHHHGEDPPVCFSYNNFIFDFSKTANDEVVTKAAVLAFSDIAYLISFILLWPRAFLNIIFFHLFPSYRPIRICTSATRSFLGVQTVCLR